MLNPFQPSLGGGKIGLKLCLLATSSALGNVGNITAGDAQIVQFTVRQAVKFVAGLTNAVPSTDVAKNIHNLIPSKTSALLADGVVRNVNCSVEQQIGYW